MQCMEKAPATTPTPEAELMTHAHAALVLLMLPTLGVVWKPQMHAAVFETDRQPHLGPVWVGDVASVADGALGHTTSPAAQRGLEISATPVVVSQAFSMLCILSCAAVLYVYGM